MSAFQEMLPKLGNFKCWQPGCRVKVDMPYTYCNVHRRVIQQRLDDDKRTANVKLRNSILD